MNRVIIGIGSNIDAQSNIQKALELLGEVGTVSQVSEWVVTAPIGITNQPPFTNGAACLMTSLDQTTLKHFLKQAENHLGRDRSLPKYGPRTIDLDIVVWNDQIVDDDYHTREFLKKAVDSLR